MSYITNFGQNGQIIRRPLPFFQNTHQEFSHFSPAPQHTLVQKFHLERWTPSSRHRTGIHQTPGSSNFGPNCGIPQIGRQYALIVDNSTGTTTTPGGMGSSLPKLTNSKIITSSSMVQYKLKMQKIITLHSFWKCK